MARKTGFGKKLLEIIALFKGMIDFLDKYGDKIKEITKEQFHKIKLRFHGKCFAVIGANRSGKTSFLKVLKDPGYEVDPMVYSNTSGTDVFNDTIIHYKPPISDNSNDSSIKLKMRKPKDVGGEKSLRDGGDWKQVCEGAHFIFYILDAYEFENNQKAKKRFNDDINWIADNNQLYAPNFGIIIFVNKMDKISSEKEKRKEWADNNLPKIEAQFKAQLEAYHKHFLLAIPISLVSKVNRANAISMALLKVVEK